MASAIQVPGRAPPLPLAAVWEKPETILQKVYKSPLQMMCCHLRTLGICVVFLPLGLTINLNVYTDRKHQIYKFISKKILTNLIIRDNSCQIINILMSLFLDLSIRIHINKTSYVITVLQSAF